MAHFEQDRDYVDMEGNLRTFTIRDYSDAGRNRQKAIINEEAAKEADDNYNKSLKESIDSLCEEVPAVFAREIDEVVIVKDERIEWDKDALFIALKHYNSCYSCRHITSIWARVNKAIFNSIKEYINCKDIDCKEKVQAWRDHFKKTQTL